jgi:pimeloyl-ACP methyl ester carboxylesterase
MPSITADELAEIEIPVRILQGDEDRGLSVENAATLAEHLPRGEVGQPPRARWRGACQ